MDDGESRLQNNPHTASAIRQALQRATFMQSFVGHPVDIAKGTFGNEPSHCDINAAFPKGTPNTAACLTLDSGQLSNTHSRKDACV